MSARATLAASASGRPESIATRARRPRRSGMVAGAPAPRRVASVSVLAELAGAGAPTSTSSRVPPLPANAERIAAAVLDYGQGRCTTSEVRGAQRPTRPTGPGVDDRDASARRVVGGQPCSEGPELVAQRGRRIAVADDERDPCGWRVVGCGLQVGHADARQGDPAACRRGCRGAGCVVAVRPQQRRRDQDREQGKQRKQEPAREVR